VLESQPVFRLNQAVRKVLERLIAAPPFLALAFAWSRTRLARAAGAPAKRGFCTTTHIDISEAEWKPAHYPPLDAFFQHASHGMPVVDVDPRTAVFPCDGAWEHLGTSTAPVGAGQRHRLRIRHLLIDETWAAL
jgi:hypothetical protein